MSYNAPVAALAPFYGAAVFFAEEGATVEATTVAEDAKPPGSNLSTWEELSCIETASLSREYDGGETRDCFNRTTGKWEKKKTQGQLASLSLDFTVQEITEFILRMAMNVASIDADGGGVPNSQAEGIFRGWLKVQQQNGTEVVTVADLWVELTMPNAMQIAGRSGATAQLSARVIDAADAAVQFGSDIE